MSERPRWAQGVQAGFGEPQGEPFGAVGEATAVRCRCGAGPHPEDAARCARGHVLTANALAVLVGVASARFWAEHEQARREVARAVVRDAGHDESDAPEALRLAADSIAMAALVQQSAFLRVVASGGPLTSQGRTRRAFAVWLQASDRLERFMRLVGLRRVPKPAPSLDAAIAALGDNDEQAVNRESEP